MSAIYSLKKDGKKKLSENFTVSEFACKDGSDYILISSELVEVLQKVRNYFKQPITITSAYRNATYNKKIGGVANSQHTLGTASDIVVSGIAPKEVAMYIEYIMPNKGGIGLYTKSNFVHIDVRDKRSRWINDGIEKVSMGFYGFTPRIEELEKNEDNVWELSHRGIISEYDKWVSIGNSNKDVYWLMRKVVYYLRKKNI